MSGFLSMLRQLPSTANARGVDTYLSYLLPQTYFGIGEYLCQFMFIGSSDVEYHEPLWKQDLVLDIIEVFPFPNEVIGFVIGKLLQFVATPPLSNRFMRRLGEELRSIALCPEQLHSLEGVNAKNIKTVTIVFSVSDCTLEPIPHDTLAGTNGRRLRNEPDLRRMRNFISNANLDSLTIQSEHFWEGSYPLLQDWGFPRELAEEIAKMIACQDLKELNMSYLDLYHCLQIFGPERFSSHLKNVQKLIIIGFFPLSNTEFRELWRSITALPSLIYLGTEYPLREGELAIIGNFLQTIEAVGFNHLNHQSAPLLVGKNISTLSFLETDMHTISTNPMAIAEACPNLKDIFITGGATLECFLAFATMPQLHEITFSKLIITDESERRKVVQVLCEKRFEWIKILDVMFLPTDIRNIMRAQGDAMTSFTFSVMPQSIAPPRQELLEICYAIYESAVRWNPNIVILHGAATGETEAEQQNILPVMNQLGDEKLNQLNRMMRVRCKLLNPWVLRD